MQVWFPHRNWGIRRSKGNTLVDHKKVKNIKRKNTYKGIKIKGKISNIEVMICTLDQRLPSLVMGTWGVSTFPMHKQLPNPHLKNMQTVVFLVFPTFSSNKRWWRLHVFSFLGRRTIESHVAPPPEGILRQRPFFHFSIFHGLLISLRDHTPVFTNCLLP